jgi:RND family efflux transporter MFP subunit
MVAGVIHGAVFSPTAVDESEDLLAIWPESEKCEPILNEISQQVLEEGNGVIRSLEHYGPGDLSTCDLVGCPLVSDDQIVGVVVLMISSRSESQQRAILQLLQWGGVWIEKLIGQRIIHQQQFGTFSTNLVAAALGLPNTHLAALETVNRLADRFKCERVSLGMRHGMSIQLLALSHVIRFDPRTQLVRRIEAAMEESADQSATIVKPNDPDRVRVVTRSHEELLKQDGCGASCTVLLPGQRGYVGALVFERKSDVPFDKEIVSECESLAKLIGHILEMRQRDEQHFFLKANEALRDFTAAVMGPTRLKLKIFALCALLLLGISSLFNGEHRITAPASIQGAIRHMLVAPQQGYVKHAEARAGDQVMKGQLIAQLDDSDLKLELRKWQGEKNKLQKVYQEALALRDRTKLSVARAQIEQVDAELQLVEGKLARTRLESPIDGLVVSGDFSQSLGALVETGQVLFEVTPLDSYLVVLEVDEFDVASLEEGKSGQLIIAALPQSTIPVTVSKVVPVAVADDGRNYFRVEATLDEPTELLRPGMEGVAKIDMGQRKLIWIWTHSLLDRLRLWIWAAGL